MKHFTKLPLRAVLFSGAAFSSLGGAMAQDVVEDDVREMETIVVTGTHLQNQLAIDARRNAESVIDSVASDDIGRLPDFNIGEALQRLPGVGIQND